MAELIKMPRLSDTMEEGTVATWFKKVGDTVQEGEILAEIETDKATMEFESFYEGTLLYIGIQENETAKVDAPLAIIGSPGDDIESILGGSKESIVEEKNENSEPEKPLIGENQDIEMPNNEDVQVISMPRLSDTMEEGTVASWFKKVGDEVEEGEILAEIETDKATMEFESFYSGTLLHVGLGEGDSAKVDSLLAIIGPKGTDVNPYLSGSKKTAEKSKTHEGVQEVIETKSEKKIDDSSKTTTKTDRIFISPLAKKLAKEKNLDISMIQGTGDSGRIIKTDIENYKEPKNYTQLENIEKLTHSISKRPLNLDLSNVYTSASDNRVKKIIKRYSSSPAFIHYNTFGTITGRLSTTPSSFPLLTLNKEYRTMIKPNNGVFIEFDYNAFELRVLTALLGREQPKGDIHDWNIKNIFGSDTERSDAKKRAFAWLYNPNSQDAAMSKFYDKEKILSTYYRDGIITTPFDRKITSDDFHALNYLMQSTASDVCLTQALKLDKLLEGKKSYITAVIHDSVLIDYDEGDKDILKELVSTYGKTSFGDFKVNISVGLNYGEMKELCR